MVNLTCELGSHSGTVEVDPDLLVAIEVEAEAVANRTVVGTCSYVFESVHPCWRTRVTHAARQWLQGSKASWPLDQKIAYDLDGSRS